MTTDSTPPSILQPQWETVTFDPFDENAELLPGLKIFFEKLIEKNPDGFWNFIQTRNACEQETMAWQTVRAIKNTGKTFSRLNLSPDNPGLANNRAALNSLIEDGLVIVNADKTKVAPTTKLILKLMAHYPEIAALNFQIGTLPAPSGNQQTLEQK